MINQVSCYVVIIMKENNIIHEKDLDWYIYGAEIFFITLIKLLTLFFLATIFGLFKEALVFILAFSSLRIQAGGLHFESFWRCLIATNILTFTAYLLIKNLFMECAIVLLPVFLILSIILVFQYAPVDTINKRLDQDEVKKYRRRSRAMILIGSVGITIFAIILGTRYTLLYPMIAATGFFTEAITLIPWVTKRKYKCMIKFYKKGGDQ